MKEFWKFYLKTNSWFEIACGAVVAIVFSAIGLWIVFADPRLAVQILVSILALAVLVGISIGLGSILNTINRYKHRSD